MPTTDTTTTAKSCEALAKQGERQPEMAQFKIGQRLEWKDISLCVHFLNSMVVVKSEPLTVKFESTGALGEVCDHQVQLRRNR